MAASCEQALARLVRGVVPILGEQKYLGDLQATDVAVGETGEQAFLGDIVGSQAKAAVVAFVVLEVALQQPHLIGGRLEPVEVGTGRPLDGGRRHFPGDETLDRAERKVRGVECHEQVLLSDHRARRGEFFHVQSDPD